MYVAGNFANFQIEFPSSFVLILGSIELITLIWYLMLITKINALATTPFLQHVEPHKFSCQPQSLYGLALLAA